MAFLQLIKIAAGTTVKKYGFDNRDYQRVITSTAGTPTTLTVDGEEVDIEEKVQTYDHETTMYLNAADRMTDDLGNVYLAQLKEVLHESTIGNVTLLSSDFVGAHPAKGKVFMR